MWIKTKGRFCDPTIPDVEWESMSYEQKLESYVFRNYRFNTDDLFAYNDSSEGVINLRFKIYDEEQAVKMTMAELDEIIFKEEMEKDEQEFRKLMNG